jgi:hypothetical protein
MRKFKLSKMWYIRLVGALSMLNFAQKIYHLPDEYIIQSSSAEGAIQAVQVANELILQAVCKFSYMFFVFAIWLMFEIAVPIYKARKASEDKSRE